MEKLNSKKFQDLKKKRLCWLSFNRRLFFLNFLPPISHLRALNNSIKIVCCSFNIFLKISISSKLLGRSVLRQQQRKTQINLTSPPPDLPLITMLNETDWLVSPGCVGDCESVASQCWQVVAITAVPPPVAAPEQQAHHSPPARRDLSAANILRWGEVVFTGDQCGQQYWSSSIKKVEWGQDDDPITVM